MFYERYLQLCEEAKIAPSAAATKAGFNRGTVSVWKKKYEVGLDVTPDQDIVDKICNFFGCTESWIRGISEQKEKSPSITGEGNTNQSIVGPEEIKAAFWGGEKDLSKEDMDAMWNDVKRFADFVAQQKKQEKKNG